MQGLESLPWRHIEGVGERWNSEHRWIFLLFSPGSWQWDAVTWRRTTPVLWFARWEHKASQGSFHVLSGCSFILFHVFFIFLGEMKTSSVLVAWHTLRLTRTSPLCNRKLYEPGSLQLQVSHVICTLTRYVCAWEHVCVCVCVDWVCL